MIDSGRADSGSNPLALLYKFENDEGPIVDDSGRGNNGLAVRVERGVNGSDGDAVEFKDHQSFIVVPDSESLSLKNDFSIEAMVYLNNNDKDRKLIQPPRQSD